MDEPLVPVAVIVGEVVVGVAAVHVPQELPVEGGRQGIAAGPGPSGPEQFGFTWNEETHVG